VTQTIIDVNRVTTPIAAAPAYEQKRKNESWGNLLTIRWSVWVSAASVIIGLLAWELVSRYVVDNKLFLVGPLDVFERMGQMFGDEKLMHDVNTSAEEFGGGMLLSVGIGIPVGLMIAL
jgi:ABC-type nitrate/sulfonate/bicarbonate transport system permease component